MKNWFEIAVPHEDIRKGGFDEAVFAADLGDVHAGKAAADYNDPYLFFRKTYPTAGLKKLLRDVHRKLAEGEGPGIVELQTPFGGGKTHSLVTVYHYLRSGADVRDLIPEDLEVIDEPALSVVVGTQLNPLKGRTTEGTPRHTLWGEMAWQIGGNEAYRELEENDQERVTPGKEALRALLEPRQPFVLLFDEILEYIVKARGVEVSEGTLGAQTLTFFKELTDTVAGLPKGLMIATLPQSDLEDFGETEELNLQKLQHVFDRTKTVATPVAGDEVYSIIRSRLFEPIKDEGALREIAQAYVDAYQENKNELPRKAREVAFREKIERAYPFHPDLIDTLDQKWGTFSTFQRTRGVLRLLANVIENLWQERENIDLVLPGDVNLDYAEIRREFIGHIGQEHESVLASDVSGASAKARLMDRDNHGWNGLSERIATVVFLHSFSAEDMEIGAPLPFIKLGVLRPDTVAPLITEILQKQRSELWYLNTRNDRYYFSSVPNLNRMVLDRKSGVRPAALREELEKRIKKELGSKFRTFLWPASSHALPDSTDVKLAVLDPEVVPREGALREWIRKRGEGFRTYQNTVFFAYPDDTGFARIQDDLRNAIALREIREDIERGDRPGLVEKASDVKRRIRDVEDRIPQRVRELYRVVLVPKAEGELERIDLGQPTVGPENLDTWYERELSASPHQKLLTGPPSSTMLKAKFLGNAPVVSLSTVREQFYKDPGLPVPLDDSFIREGVANAVAQAELGLGRGKDDEIRPDSVRIGEPIASTMVELDDGSFLLSAERAQELKAAVDVEVGEGGGKTGVGTELDDDEVLDGDKEQPGLRFGEDSVDEKVRSLRLRASGIPVGKLADLHRGVLQPLLREVGAFSFSIELDVSGEGGISKKVIEQQVMETLRQLGADVEMGDDQEAE